MPRSRFHYVRYLLGILACCCVSAVAAELDYPLSIAVTDSGIMYLADRNLPGVWKLEGEKLTLFFEGSRKFRTPLNAIRCVAVDRDGKLLAGDSATRDVYRFDDAGKPVGLTQKPASAEAAPSASPPAAAKAEAKKDEGKKDDGKKEEAKKEKVKPDDSKKAEEKKDDVKKDESKKDSAPTAADKKADVKKADPPKSDGCDDKPAAQAAPAPPRPKFIFGEIGIPMDIAVDKAGDLFVCDLEIHRIVKVAKQGGPAHEFVKIQAPRGLCLDNEENLWVVSGRKLVKVSPAGEKKTIVEDGTFSFPHTVAVAPDKTAYVCDGYEKCIWKVPPGGKPEKLISGDPLMNPVGMRLVGDKLYVVDPRVKAVFQITLDGKLTKLPMKP